MTTAAGYLAIYLNDHLAGAAAGIAVARRCHRSNQGSHLGETLSELIDELAEDKRVLESVMAAHGIRRSRLKQAATIVGERVGRLKLNGSLIRYSPLSRLVELEALRLGIYAKRALWETLLTLEGLAHDREEIQEAAERADRQIERVEGARRDAATRALAAESRPSRVG